TVCVVGKMRDLILQLSKSSIYSTKPYGALKAEKDNYFSGKKYNSRGGYITGSYSWINGNCGDVDAQKFRGRGFKMLTGLNTYSSYWVYRGWLSKNDFDKYWWDDPEYKKKIQPV
ncbi:hypothetical protein POY00_25305, partial [Klebsiella pneumoniae]